MMRIRLTTMMTTMMMMAPLVVVVRGDLVETIRNFLPPNEIQAMKESILHSSSSSSGQEEDKVKLAKMLVQRIQKLSGVVVGKEEDSSSCVMNDEAQEDVLVPVKTMTKTTHVHQDRYVMRDGAPFVQDQVAFIVLENTKGAGSHQEEEEGAAAAAADAKFVHGHEELLLEEGSLMTFSGHVKHHTIVPHHGSVKIAGPFHIASMERVGHGGTHCYVEGGDDTCGGYYCELCNDINTRCYPSPRNWLGCAPIQGHCYREKDCVDILSDDNFYDGYDYYDELNEAQCFSKPDAKSYQEYYNDFSGNEFNFGDCINKEIDYCVGDFFLVANNKDNNVIQMMDGTKICKGTKFNIWANVDEALSGGTEQLKLLLFKEIEAEEEEDVFGGRVRGRHRHRRQLHPDALPEEEIRDQCENEKPYALYGDDPAGEFKFRRLDVGRYHLEIFCNCDGTGAMDEIMFDVVECPNSV